MLQLYLDAGGKVCQTAGYTFINDRLIQLMKDAMIEYVEFIPSYCGQIRCGEDWNKPLEMVIDMDRLRADTGFVHEYILLNGLLPEGYDEEQALHYFFSLYDLLKAEKEYKPELVMEYILYHLISNELDLCRDMPEPNERVKRIPEPVRSQMLREIMEEAVGEDNPQEYVDFAMSQFEDLGEYFDSCFEDADCLLLDRADADTMKESGFADQYGIHLMGDASKIHIQHSSGAEIEFDISPWLTESNTEE